MTSLGALLLLVVLLARCINVVSSAAVHVSPGEQGSCMEVPRGMGEWICDQFTKMPKTIAPDPEKVFHLNMRRSPNSFLTRLEKNSIKPFPNLRSLNLLANRITSVDVLALTGCLHLDTLDLSNNLINVSSLPQGVLMLTYLKTLILYNNRLLGPSIAEKNKEPGYRATWLASHSLEQLDLSFCGLIQLPEWVVEGLPFLRILDVSGNQLTTIHPLVPVSVCRLTLLRAAGNPWNCSFSQNTLSVCMLRNSRVQGLFCHGIKSCNKSTTMLSRVLQTTRYACLDTEESRLSSHTDAFGLSTKSIVMVCLLILCGFLVIFLLAKTVAPLLAALEMAEACCGCCEAVTSCP